ncbi:MAG: viroplasmin family protein [Parabacteroides sp.]
MAKNKYYVVWKGLQPGVYDNWNDCKQQVHNQTGAKYKAFETEAEAHEAFEKGYTSYLKSVSSPKAIAQWEPEKPIGRPINESIAVDAACSGNPGDMEYRGVYTATGQEIFHIGPLKKGTNNVGEFLALVHGLALLQQKGSPLPIYSDSRNAIKWVEKKKCKTLLERMPENEPIFDLIERAEKWLETHEYTTPIYKWETSVWGEIPADFGRK